tara:strand:+ start:43642 stop:44913 length:1272 start_codon:yes stop_codon:yes gene_type:complete
MQNKNSFPITDDQISNIFSPLINKKKIALAVSGGRDSNALMLLVSKWILIKILNIEVHVLTINHKLRKESDNECLQVSKIAKSYGFKHKIITWSHKEIKTSIQEQAREARYKLMLNYLKKYEIDVLLTGHTLDDQVETFIMRLSKGSGLDGLRSIQKDRVIDQITLHRPLLGIKRSMTTKILECSNKEWIDDPYNDDLRFERIKIRKNLHYLENLNITHESINKSISRLTRSQEAIKNNVNKLFFNLVEINNLGYLTIKRPQIDNIHEDFIIRILQRCLGIVSGGKRVSLSSLETVYNDMIRTCKSKTISGCIIKVLSDRYVVAREIRDFKSMYLKSGDEITWDNRFNILLKSSANDALIIKNLGASNYLKNYCQDTYLENLPKYIINALPGGFIKDKLVLLPNIHNIYSSSDLIVKFKLLEE